MSEESPYTAEEQQRLAEIHEKLTNADTSVSPLQKHAWRRSVLAIERKAQARVVAAEQEQAAREKEKADALAAELAAKAEEDALPKPPTLEQCSNDPEIFKVEMALYHVLLDELAAQRLLDSPKSSLKQREDARRALRKVAERRHEMAPHFYDKDGQRISESSGPADTAQEPPDPRRWWKKNPFDARLAKGGTSQFQKAFEDWLLRCGRSAEIPPLRATGTHDFEREFHSWKSKSNFFDEIERVSTMEPEEKKSYWRGLSEGADKRAAESMAASQRAIDEGHNPRLFHTPLQEEAWAAQSKYYESLRELKSAKPAPAPAVPQNRQIAYELSDGFRFWEDLSACPSPLPAGTTVHRALSPPDYNWGDNRIALHWRYDPINYIWLRTQ